MVSGCGCSIVVQCPAEQAAMQKTFTTKRHKRHKRIHELKAAIRLRARARSTSTWMFVYEYGGIRVRARPRGFRVRVRVRVSSTRSSGGWRVLRAFLLVHKF